MEPCDGAEGKLEGTAALMKVRPESVSGARSGVAELISPWRLWSVSCAASCSIEHLLGAGVDVGLAR